MPQLQGCINDVCYMGRFLEGVALSALWDDSRLILFFWRRTRVSPENIRILTDDPDDRTMWPTKANILSSIDWLVGGAKEDDEFFLHCALYSPHLFPMPSSFANT